MWFNAVTVLLGVSNVVVVLADIVVNEDPKVRLGQPIKLECLLDDVTARVTDCAWVAPDGNTRYDTLEAKPEAKVSVDDRNNKCVLNIRSSTEMHNGPWECVVTSDAVRAADSNAFVFVRVSGAAAATGANAPLTIDLAEEQLQVEAGVGDSAQLSCPATSTGLCFWTDPTGREYRLRGVRGEVHVFDVDGVRSGVDPASAACAINIDPVAAKHFGVWKCKVLTGSDVVEAEVMLLDVGGRDSNQLRTSKLESSRDRSARLGTFASGDRDVEVLANASMSQQDQSQRTELFWIAQRKYIVQEGRSNCPTKSSCYTSSQRKKLSAFSGAIASESLYQLSLRIDVADAGDVSQPLVLVKRPAGRPVQMYFVTKGEAGGDLDAVGGFSTSRPGSGRGCVVGGRRAGVGDVVEYPEFCVEVECVSQDGEVQLYKMRNCRQSDSETQTSEPQSVTNRPTSSDKYQGSGFNK